ncbi:MAG: C40 family peptidase, partial [Burkholderiales bacterium]
MRRIWIPIILLALLPLSAIANDGNESAAPSAAAESGMLDQAQEIVLRALSFIGVRYKYGGTTPDTGFDCSGLIRYVFNQATGKALPGNAREISQVGSSIDRTELK